MSLHDRITGALFPMRLDEGSDVTLATGFVGRDPTRGRIGLFHRTGPGGQGSPQDGTAYFEDVATWQDCVDWVEWLKGEFGHAEDRVFTELQERIRDFASR
jgi:hypothetical protein